MLQLTFLFEYGIQEGHKECWLVYIYRILHSRGAFAYTMQRLVTMLQNGCRSVKSYLWNPQSITKQVFSLESKCHFRYSIPVNLTLWHRYDRSHDLILHFCLDT